MKKDYKVKLGVMVYYEVEVNIDADNVVEAMDVVVDGYNKNLLSPMKAVHTTAPGIISVSRRKD
jgi:hypothetical protein